MAILNAIIGYLGLQLAFVALFGTVHTLSSTAEFFATVGETGLAGVSLLLERAPWWIYIFLGVEVLIVGLGSSVAAQDMVKETPFCERCEQWYSQGAAGVLATSSADALIKALESGDSRFLDEVVPVSPKAYPQLAVSLKKCLSCDVSNFYLAVSLAWEELAGTKRKRKQEFWVKTMTAPEMGKILEGLFRPGTPPRD